MKEFSRAYTARRRRRLLRHHQWGEQRTVCPIPALAERFPNLHLLGRLAEYKYYNMDAIVARALELCDQLLSK